uniref:Methylated-DNA--protein-cysteine methyltransferase n=1 Tax=Phallusia mammillata TaxID=59560 RepID=A0A6F9DLM3_9ASCI|nr:methylated-DNA--protein-cysteine methyltransferase-like [Phallusia mammillata]
MSQNVMSAVVLQTPIGIIHSTHTSKGVQSIKLDQSYNENPTIINKNFGASNVEVIDHSGPLDENVKSFIDWLKAFFGDGQMRSLPAIDNEIIDKQNFTGLVLRTLMMKTSCGSTLSYADLAKLCNSPKACRAVGQAMRANPIPLIVPCHRVVGSNGKLGHYMSGKGDNIKAWLLDHEKMAAGAL